MGRIVAFFIFISLIMIYPVYVLMNQKINKNCSSKANISLYTIYNGKFRQYNVNLTKIGYFKQLDIFKHYYLATDLNVTDLLKKESYFAKKAKYQYPYLFATFFIYKNSEYLLKSHKARYNFKTKKFSGNEFFLLGKTYKAKGKSFVVDKYKNIKATYPIFDLKVKE